MMLYAKPPEMIPAAIDAVKLVAGVVAELAPQAAQQGTDLIFDGAADRLDMQGDALQLAVAIRSLCVNALEALGGGGTVVVTVRPGMAHPDNGAEYVEIEVRDSGPGIPRASRRHLFDPFYSGREAGRGLGLGLSKCWRIVTLHGGHIEVESDSRSRGDFHSAHAPQTGRRLPVQSDECPGMSDRCHSRQSGAARQRVARPGLRAGTSQST